MECGANDGEQNSNTLLFEMYHYWDGLLIEANLYLFRELLKKNRRAYLVQACLSPRRTPQMVNFTRDSLSGGISDFIPTGQQKRRRTGRKLRYLVQCLPVYSILAALRITHVDYFSLDVEGPEVEILRTLPLNKTIVDVFSIEKRIMGDSVSTLRKETDIKSVLQSYGYMLSHSVKFDVIMSRL